MMAAMASDANLRFINATQPKVDKVVVLPQNASKRDKMRRFAKTLMVARLL